MVEASHETRLGHPRKYSEGWENINKWIYFSNETLLNGGDWLWEQRSLFSNNSMAYYLPTLLRDSWIALYG